MVNYPTFLINDHILIFQMYFNTGSMRQGGHFSQTKKKSEKPVIDIIDFKNKYAL